MPRKLLKFELGLFPWHTSWGLLQLATWLCAAFSSKQFAVLKEVNSSCDLYRKANIVFYSLIPQRSPKWGEAHPGGAGELGGPWECGRKLLELV